jgi:Pentapeptide repeats (8 copies)
MATRRRAIGQPGHREWPVLGWILAVAGVVAMLLSVVLVVPRLLYPPVPASQLVGVAPDKRIEVETNRLKLQNDARAALLQGLGGAVLLFGAYTAWRQLQQNATNSSKQHDLYREGQITERFTRAVDQLGSEHLDVRIGGIYALERIARDSQPDRATIEEILTAFVRGHAPWPPKLPDQPPEDTPTQKLLPLGVRAADVHAAVIVLSRRQLPPDGLRPLVLARVDLRGTFGLHEANFQGALFGGANLLGMWFLNANLQGAHFDDCNLQGAIFDGANLQDAVLEGASLQGATLNGANLQGARLGHARADAKTIWPTGFDLHRAGVIVTDRRAAEAEEPET